MVRGLTVVSCALVMCVALAIVGRLSLHGANTAPFLYFFGTVVGPILGIGYNNVKTKQVKDSVDSVQETVSTIEHQTNGALTARIRDAVNSALEAQQKQLTDVVKEAMTDQVKTDLEGK